MVNENSLIYPAYHKVGSVNINGKSSKRLMMVLKTSGCEYARKNDGGCTMCGFIKHAHENITENDMKKQFIYSLENNDLSEVEEIDVLTIGSFYNEREISSSFREYVLSTISKMENVKRITIESRPEYITLEKLKESKRIVGDKILECGIGLESSNDYIRNEIINKSLTKEMFEEKVSLYKEANITLSAYILVKPVGLSEEEAIEDAVESAKYVFETAKRNNLYARVAFEPVFICDNTQLEKDFLEGRYKLLNLWSMVEIIKRVHHLGEIFVGLSDEDLSSERMPSSCNKCNKLVIEKIEEFNKKQDIEVFDNIVCECACI